MKHVSWTKDEVLCVKRLLCKHGDMRSDKQMPAKMDAVASARHPSISVQDGKYRKENSGKLVDQKGGFMQ